MLLPSSLRLLVYADSSLYALCDLCVRQHTLYFRSVFSGTPWLYFAVYAICPIKFKKKIRHFFCWSKKKNENGKSKRVCMWMVMICVCMVYARHSSKYNDLDANHIKIYILSSQSLWFQVGGLFAITSAITMRSKTLDDFCCVGCCSS